MIEKAHDFWADLNPWLKGMLVAALVAALGYFGGRPAYRAFRSWRCTQNLAEAREKMSQGDAPRARELALAVLHLDGNRFEAIQILGQTMPSLSDPLAPSVAMTLLADPRSSEEDREHSFQTIVENCPLAMAGTAWNQIGPERQKQMPYRLAFVRRLIDQTNYSEASGLLRECANLAEEPQLEAERIRLLVLSRDEGAWKEAQERSRTVCKADGPEAGRILTLIEGIPADHIDPACAAAAMDWLGAHKEQVEIGPRLAVEYLRLAAKCPNPDPERRKLVESVAREAPDQIALWLVRHNHVDEALAILPNEDQARTAAWFLARCEVLRAAEHWTEWKDLLVRAPPQISRMEVACDLAIACDRLGQIGPRLAAWNTAMAEAGTGSSGNNYLVLAQRAEKAGLQAQAEDAMVQAILLGRGRLPLFQRLQPLILSLAKQGRERDLLQVESALLGLEPANPVLIANHAYLACLTGSVAPPALRERLAPLRKVLPNAVPVRCVLAATWLADAKGPEAMAELQIEGVDWRTASPGYRAIYGAALLCNGRTDQAEQILKDLPWPELLPCERQFFHDVRNRTASPSGMAQPSLPPR